VLPKELIEYCPFFCITSVAVSIGTAIKPPGHFGGFLVRDIKTNWEFMPL
jgi:hypothetical protein